MRKLMFIAVLFLGAIGILGLSVFRTAQIGAIGERQPGNKIAFELIPESLNASDSAGRVNSRSIGSVCQGLIDKARLFLTSDPAKKAELCVDIAERRVDTAGKLMVDKKPRSALLALEKGEKYFTRAVDYFKTIDEKGNTKDLQEKIESALNEHIISVLEMEKLAETGETKKLLTEQIKDGEQLVKKVVE